RTIDVAADLSFLAMELEAAGRGDLAAVLVTAYAAAADDPLVQALMPYHAAYRAVVRGKVEGLTAADAAVEPGERRSAAERPRARRARHRVRVARRRSGGDRVCRSLGDRQIGHRRPPRRGDRISRPALGSAPPHDGAGGRGALHGCGARRRLRTPAARDRARA